MAECSPKNLQSSRAYTATATMPHAYIHTPGGRVLKPPPGFEGTLGRQHPSVGPEDDNTSTLAPKSKMTTPHFRSTGTTAANNPSRAGLSLNSYEPPPRPRCKLTRLLSRRYWCLPAQEACRMGVSLQPPVQSCPLHLRGRALQPTMQEHTAPPRASTSPLASVAAPPKPSLPHPQWSHLGNSYNQRSRSSPRSQPWPKMTTSRRATVRRTYQTYHLTQTLTQSGLGTMVHLELRTTGLGLYRHDHQYGVSRSTGHSQGISAHVPER